MRSVMITGSRTTEHHAPEHYAALFHAYLSPFAYDAHFYLGGARGIDSLALEWLAYWTTAQLTVAVPGTLDQQPPEARHAVARSWERVTHLVELGAEALDADAYDARNRWMVDRTTLTIGFPVGNIRRSATRRTLAYAAEQDKACLIVPV